MIEVCDYDPSWTARFQALRDEYAHAMSSAGVPVLAIEHVGSTAVPGLAAKPVIDCDIVVDARRVDAACAVLEGLGFAPRGERGIPQRWAFWEPERLSGTNTYIVVAGSLGLRNHLALRDTLRSNAALREEYGRVKKRVAATAADIDEYGAGKNELVQRILAAAGLTQAELASIDSNQVPATTERPGRAERPTPHEPHMSWPREAREGGEGEAPQVLMPHHSELEGCSHTEEDRPRALG